MRPIATDVTCSVVCVSVPFIRILWPLVIVVVIIIIIHYHRRRRHNSCYHCCVQVKWIRVRCLSTCPLVYLKTSTLQLPSRSWCGTSVIHLCLSITGQSFRQSHSSSRASAPSAFHTSPKLCQHICTSSAHLKSSLERCGYLFLCTVQDIKKHGLGFWLCDISCICQLCLRV